MVKTNTHYVIYKLNKQHFKVPDSNEIGENYATDERNAKYGKYIVQHEQIVSKIPLNLFYQ